jgi:DNA-binding response OmpR family regulator/predicted regulator of Ras-like GTPase activity (Roadblock/LC7/MglB family)
MFPKNERHGESRSMHKRRPKIVILDNDEATVSSIQDSLSSYADCLGATSYEEAIAKIEKEKGISLVVSEIRMPGRDGFDLLLWLRENRPKVKVVMVTAYGSPVVRALAKQKGAVMYLEKPLDLKQLMITIRMIVERKGFSMAIQDMEFTDLLQFLSLAGRAVKVQVTNNIGEEGEIGLEGDTVLWVRTSSHEGEEAFFEIVRWEGGGFEMRPLDKEERNTGEEVISLSYLLLEGARRKDEDRLSETKEEAAREEKEGKPEAPEERTGRVRAITVLLEELEREIPDVIVAAVVSIDEGVPLVATTHDSAFDVDIIAAYYAEVIKTNEKALAVLKKGPRLKEVLVTTDEFYLVVRPLPGTRFYVGLVMDQKGNVGMARMVMKRYEKRFLETVPTD